MAEPKKSTWTDEEKHRFSLQILKQLGAENTPLKYDKFDMPGRSVKALKEMWLKTKKELLMAGGESAGAEGSSATATPKRKKAATGEGSAIKKAKTKKAAGRKNKQIAAEDEVQGSITGDDDNKHEEDEA